MMINYDSEKQVVVTSLHDSLPWFSKDQLRQPEIALLGPLCSAVRAAVWSLAERSWVAQKCFFCRPRSQPFAPSRDPGLEELRDNDEPSGAKGVEP